MVSISLTRSIAAALLLSNFIFPSATLEEPQDAPRRNIAERNRQNVEIVRFALINVETQTEVKTVSLDEDAIISLDNLLPTNLFSVEAVTNGSIDSVVFDFDGRTSYKKESIAPYSLCGNREGSFIACSNLGLGIHTITANALVTGSAPVSKTVSFACTLLFTFFCLVKSPSLQLMRCLHSKFQL